LWRLEVGGGWADVFIYGEILDVWMVFFLLVSFFGVCGVVGVTLVTGVVCCFSFSMLFWCMLLYVCYVLYCYCEMWVEYIENKNVGWCIL